VANNVFDAKTKWIWKIGGAYNDEYAEFIADFNLTDLKEVYLKISFDGTFCAYLNGEVVGFSKCSDFPHYKYYDLIDLSKYCKNKNTLKICVWHNGTDDMTYFSDDAGVIFEVVQNGRVLVKSDETTHSRLMDEYKNGYMKNITMQLGNSFLYDNRPREIKYFVSQVVNKPLDFVLRPTKALVLGERSDFKVIYTGEKSVLIDLGMETVGFLDLDIESETEQKLTVAYGEHIADGRVRRIIGNRDFSVEFVAKKGSNTYVNYFRRLAGRYLELLFETPVKINYIGLKTVQYPTIAIKRTFSDPLVQKIYDTCIHTLKCCMFEHYEDCPWREQSLYALDGRHQMLSGYYAFEGSDYQRANLVLMSKGVNDYGMLDICFPIRPQRTIPSFSLFYILAVCEYVEKTGDRTLLEEVSETIQTIISTFSNAIDKTGLIPEFKKPQWNFYEWNKFSNGLGKGDGTVYSLILNCLFVLVVERYNNHVDTAYPLDSIRTAIKDYFRLADGSFRNSSENESRDQLGNALAILCGIGDSTLAEKLVTDTTFVSATLAMRGFVYDALLSFGDTYKEYVLDDIKTRYKNMLDQGATTFWETEGGLSAFCGAGSLCHGWSALPVYYFSKLIK